MCVQNMMIPLDDITGGGDSAEEEDSFVDSLFLVFFFVTPCDD